MRLAPHSLGPEELQSPPSQREGPPAPGSPRVQVTKQDVTVPAKRSSLVREVASVEKANRGDLGVFLPEHRAPQSVLPLNSPRPAELTPKRRQETQHPRSFPDREKQGSRPVHTVTAQRANMPVAALASRAEEKPNRDSRGIRNTRPVFTGLKA